MKLAGVMLLAVAALGQGGPGVSVDEAAVRLSFPAGRFLLDLPVAAGGRAAAVTVKAELLGFSDNVGSQTTASCALNEMTTHCLVPMPAADFVRQSVDNSLPLLRLRYTVTTAGGAVTTGILALAHIAPTLYELHVTGPENVHPGGTYTAHIRALQPVTGAPQGGVALVATVSASFDDKDKDATLQRTSVRTNAQGFASVNFTAPVSTTLSSVDVEIEGTVANLHPWTSQTMNVPEHASTDLTTDKPLYQPGQTVHTRVLLLDRNGHARGREKIEFDVKDPDSTLVFRTEAVTSSYGIATMDWAVPASMRLGSYSIQASPEAGQNQRISVRLSRYDLPTFTVDPKPDKPFYLPGTNAAVEVRANYLFGKPVLHGHVRVVREDDRTWNFSEQKYDTTEGAVVEGELDVNGSFVARLNLAEDEKEFADEDASNEFHDVHYAAYVKDASSGRTEQRRFDVRVTAQALHVYWNNQNDQVKGLPQHFYLSVTRADGVPAECDVDVLLLPEESSKADQTLADRVARATLLQHLRTDARGLARLDLPEYEALLKAVPGPLKSDQPQLLLRAHDAAGDAGALMEGVAPPVDVLRVTTAKALYRAGDAIEVAVDSGEAALPVTVQLLRRTMHGDLLLASRDVTLKAGHAQVEFASDANDPHYSGYLFVSAISLRDRKGAHNRYRYGRSSEDDDPIVTASRAILFPRDNALHVAVKMSKEQYRPGDEATATLTVRGPRDPDGDVTEPAASAVGLVAVDQAVAERNRTDSDFGNADGQSFFFPWHSYVGSGEVVGGLSLGDLQQQNAKKPFAADLQLSAEMMLSRLKVEPETADTAPQTDLNSVFNQVLTRQLEATRKALAADIKRDLEAPTTAAALAALLSADGVRFDELRDPWGEHFEVTSTATSYGQRSLWLRSRGPDKLAGTADDFNVMLASWSWYAPFERDLKRLVNGYHDRTWGFIRDLPELQDEAKREGIDVRSWRDPWGQAFTFTFEVSQTNYVVGVTTRGDPAVPLQPAYRSGAYASINYFNGERARIETILNQYAVTHAYPTNDAELEAAGVSLATTRDPWDRPLYATYRRRSFFTDRVTVEAHATQGTMPQTRTTITPVTEIADIITLHSMGPDRAKNSEDDFVLAEFTHAQSQQNAREATAARPANQTVRSAETGALMGAVTDPTGAVIAGAIIVAKNLTTGAEYEARSEQDGTYVIDPIPAGEYDLRMSAPGFMTLNYHQVKVLAPDATILDAKLNIGSANETVEVTADALTLQTSSAMASIAAMRPGLMALPAPPPPAQATAATPRLRDYFPETLLWRPEIITSADGSATAHFKVADSITTWTVSAAASTREGNTGAGAAQFRSFQPFFAAFDPPRILTVGDHIALPITLRNYLDHALSVSSELKTAPWFRVDGAATQATEVPKQDAASPVFAFTATAMATDAPQRFLTRGADAGDNISKPVTVHPDGLPTWVSTAGILKAGETSLTLTVPADAIVGGNDARVRLYPNLGAHLRDALVQMVEYPGGCAEQITSTVWPSLLLQQHAAALPRPDKKLQKQTHEYLEEAYENLLGDQLADGGFGYWQQDRYSDAALTAYVIQFLTQAGQFIAVDENVVKRAVSYLAKEQQKDGQWLQYDRDHKPLKEDRIGKAMLTASIAAMIAKAPDAQPLVTKALAATEPFVAEYDEPYTLASYALAAIAVKDKARGDAAITRLRGLALTENGGAYWKLETNTPFFGWGRAGRVEATAQTLRALLAAGAEPQDELVARGLMFLDHEQDRHAMWYSTQATARVLDVMSAIALKDGVPRPRGAAGTLVVAVDGRAITKTALAATDKDAGPIYVPLGGALGAGEHRITLTLPPSAGSATAQVVANVYRPWPAVAAASATTNNEQLRMAIAFHKTSPAIGEAVEEAVHIERIGFRGYGMLIAEIGLPPGADVDRASLESAMKASDSQVNHYEVQPDRVLVYVWPKAGGLDLKFKFALRYGVDALTAPSTVYDYYNPDSHFDLAPGRFTVR